ncbi:MAG: hypothetical protein ACYDB7_15755, partial [Mycobacteriales bacterium]
MALLEAVDDLPEQVADIPVREAVTTLARCLADAPSPPLARRELVDAALADGIPFGALTGQRIDERPTCLVAAKPHQGSTFAGVLVHEALHANDMLCGAPASIVEQLRPEQGGPVHSSGTPPFSWWRLGLSAVLSIRTITTTDTSMASRSRCRWSSRTSIREE